jgi:hypothetical protein
VKRYKFNKASSFKNISLAVLFAVLTVSCASEKESKEEIVDELPFKTLALNDLENFQDGGTNGWVTAENVFMDRQKKYHCEIGGGKGMVVSRGDDNDNQLITKLEHGDLDLKMDFMLAKNSVALLFLQGCYGIQLSDSWKNENLSEQSSGVILSGDSNKLPALNVSKAPGLWQHLVIKFKAPRFDSSGRKVTDALFTEVILNGKRIHKDVAVNPVTQSAPSKEERERAPLVIISKFGPVAFRSIEYKNYEDKRIEAEGIGYKVYKGLFREYDTLDGMKPLRTGTVDSIHWAVGDKRAQITFEGNLQIPADGDYLFKLRAGGPAWVLLNKELVVGNGGTRNYTDARYGKIALKKGTHPFQIIYANYDESLVVEYEGPEMPLTKLTALTSERFVQPIGPFEYMPGNKAVVQRAFFTHHNKVNPYTMCVSVPEGLNYAFDLSTYSILSVWHGKFIDVGNMWLSRGESQMAIPLGAALELSGVPPVSQLTDAKDPWIDTVDVINNRYSKRGYRIDASGLPVFTYTYNDLAVEDYLHPDENTAGWKRSVTLKTSTSENAGNIFFLLGSGKFIERLPNGEYAIDDKKYYISGVGGIDEKNLIIEKKKDRYELLLPVTVSQEAPLKFNYSIIW